MVKNSQNKLILHDLFNTFNSMFFDKKIMCADIIIRERIVSNIVLRVDKIKAENMVHYYIYISEEYVHHNNKIMVAIELLTQMVLIYGEQNNIKMSSNNGGYYSNGNVQKKYTGRYKNKRFYQKAMQCGLVCCNTESHSELYYKTDKGYTPYDVSKEVKQVMQEIQFVDEKVYYKQLTSSHKNPIEKSSCGNHQRHYCDERTGGTIWVTKEHKLIMLDGLPEDIINKICLEYGLSLMKQIN